MHTTDVSSYLRFGGTYRFGGRSIPLRLTQRRCAFGGLHGRLPSNNGVRGLPPTSKSGAYFASPRFAQRASGKVQRFAFIERRTDYALIRREYMYDLPRPGCHYKDLLTNYRQRRAGSLRCERAHIIRLRK